ncbi:MAG TPA: hypothetical protein VGN12_26635 [Pirellulales bacterium]|jgi:hypothetical protein
MGGDYNDAMGVDSQIPDGQGNIDWNTFPPSLFGLFSLMCAGFWGTSIFGYWQAVPFVLLGSALGILGLIVARRRFTANKRGSRWMSLIMGAGLCILGIIANAGLFAVALVDL